MTEDRRELSGLPSVPGDMTSPSRVPVAQAATRDLKEAKSTPLEKVRESLETEEMRSKTARGRSRISSVSSTSG